jgi:predicted GNAT family acetyltransferase
MEIIQEKGTTKGAFFAKENDRVIGEMTYVWSGNHSFTIDHTEVDDRYQGLGVGKKMVEKAVEFARENNYTIYPLCPFVRGFFDKNPTYSDVLN